MSALDGSCRLTSVCYNDKLIDQFYSYQPQTTLPYTLNSLLSKFSNTASSRLVPEDGADKMLENREPCPIKEYHHVKANFLEVIFPYDAHDRVYFESQHHIVMPN